MNVLKPHQKTTVATLLDAGTSQRQIGRLTGIDRKTIRAVQLRLAAERSNSPGVATGSALQTPPPWPPAGATATPTPTPTSVSACEPHRLPTEVLLEYLTDVLGRAPTHADLVRIAASGDDGTKA